MEALDQLLMACHSQSIKPFVESFLHMVAKLLESREPDLQVLGTNSVRLRPGALAWNRRTPLCSVQHLQNLLIQPLRPFGFNLMEDEMRQWFREPIRNQHKPVVSPIPGTVEEARLAGADPGASSFSTRPFRPLHWR